MRTHRLTRKNTMIRERKWRAFATLSFRREWVKVELRRRMRKNGAKTYD